ncbi:MAG TPA: hypothetical protein VJ790_09075 [Dongiaceae bacterium]|nr:hypothetical protein [Dongiaceae bacterium]
MTHASWKLAGFFVLALSACAGPAVAPSPTGQIAISPQTEGALSAYLRRVKVTRPGAFAVSPDGANSFYTWCGDTACATANYSIPALRGCQSLAGTPCVILYVRHEPRLQYTRSAPAAAGRHGSEEQRRIDYDVRGR